MAFSLRYKLTLINLALIFSTTLIASLIINRELQSYYKSRLQNQLRLQLDEIAFLLTSQPVRPTGMPWRYAWLAQYARAGKTRITLIDSTGRVLFDSRVARDSLVFVENHLLRPEIQMALRTGSGHHERVSATLQQPMLYSAKRPETSLPWLQTGQTIKFIRVAIPLADVKAAFTEIRWKIIFGSSIALLLIAVASFWIAKRMTDPIRKLARTAKSVTAGKLEVHFSHDSDDEIGQLADDLNRVLETLRSDLIEMRKLQTMRSQFLGNVSHELRTPIFTLQGYLETLLEKEIADPAKQKEFLQKAYRVSNRLQNLLTDLIDISRIESREMKMSFRYFDVGDWLQQQIADLQEEAAAAGVRLSFRQSVSRRKVSALGDTERLAQVIANLVNNAIKYNVPGGTVEVGFREKAATVEIYVQDTGGGIAAEHLPRIFERFYRVDRQRSRALGGTGLGLAIVKHIIEAHGSRITVESKPGEGSVFGFELRKK